MSEIVNAVTRYFINLPRIPIRIILPKGRGGHGWTICCDDNLYHKKIVAALKERDITGFIIDNSVEIYSFKKDDVHYSMPCKMFLDLVRGFDPDFNIQDANCFGEFKEGME